VKLSPAAARVGMARSQAVALSYDASVVTAKGEPGQGCFDCTLEDPTGDGQGHALPAEMLPAKIAYDGVEFSLAPAGTGQNNAVIARGQNIALPAGNFNRAYLLAAATGGDQDVSVLVDGKATELTVPEWTGFIGQWDSREWAITGGTITPAERKMEFSGKIAPGFIKRADVAWYSSHRHGTDGQNEAYSYSYLFAFPVDIPVGAKTLTLPKNEKVRILAISVADDHARVQPAQPLYDTLRRVGAESVGER
jgi:alpha-mannosidase